MRWRRRRQHHRPIALRGKLRRKLAGRLAVEAHHFQLWAQPVQPLEIVGRRLADGGVQAALALAGAQHIPQADAVRQQARQAQCIWQRYQVFARQRRQDGPQRVDVLVKLTPQNLRHSPQEFASTINLPKRNPKRNTVSKHSTCYT